jgi:hypothetical protein
MATLQERLAEAEAALHDALIGRAVREVRDSNGEQISYTAVNTAKLAGYIADLKRQISQTGSGPMFLVMS